MSRSTLVGGIAGLLLIADGVSFVSARTALLDGFLAFFVVAAFGALIVDRDQVRERMHVALLEGRIGETPWGPRLGVRWWRFGAGVLLGLACATKWSGLYFVVFFGVMTLAFDVAARRQYRVPRPWLGMLRRDLGPAAYALGLIPFLVYLASYAPWFASETAINRYEVGRSIGEDSILPIPDALRSLWHYTYAVYRVPCRADQRRRQPPPVGIQAVDMADVAAAGAVCDRQPERAGLRRAVVRGGGDAGRHARRCGSSRCRCSAGRSGGRSSRRDWRYAAILVGYGAGFLPWFADIDRQMYFFYAATMAPFLVMAIAMILGDILHKPNQNAERRTLGLIVVSCYVALVITNFAWMYPILTGLPISQATWNMQIWLPAGGRFRAPKLHSRS